MVGSSPVVQSMTTSTISLGQSWSHLHHHQETFHPRLRSRSDLIKEHLVDKKELLGEVLRGKALELGKAAGVVATDEGLLDETFGISCGTVEFPPEVTKTETATKLQLSCKDKMFDKIRNKHFATIFSVLGVTAKQLAAAQVLEKY